MVRLNFVDHLVWRVGELDRTERFYTALLGQPPHRAADSLMFKVGDTRLFFTCSKLQQDGQYEKEKVGLNHIAFGVSTLEELEAVRKQLDSAGLSHSGITVDHCGLKEFIWLDDPDGMRIEFYCRGPGD